MSVFHAGASLDREYVVVFHGTRKIFELTIADARELARDLEAAIDKCRTTARKRG